MKILLVDDEPVARRRLRRMLARMDAAEVVGEAGDGAEALEFIRSLRPDLVLLDIQMPGMTGLELATADDLPAIVFTTAHDEHAVEAFDLAAVDYLLKPISEERLAQALERVGERGRRGDDAALRDALRRLAERQGAPVRLHARHGRTTHLLDPAEVTRLHASEKYTLCQHGGRELVLDEPLSTLETRLGPLGFLRVHRSELVNLHHVRALHADGGALAVELSDGQRAPVSRRMAASLRERLGLDA